MHNFKNSHYYGYNNKLMKNLVNIGFAQMLVCLTLTLVSCHKDKDLNPETDYINYDSDKGEIGKGGGIIKISDPNNPLANAFIEVPANALSTEIELSIAETELPHPFEGKDNLIHVTLNPSGTKFNLPVNIGIPYNQDQNPDNLGVFFYDEENFTWKPFLVKSIDREKRIITAQTNHFTECVADIGNVHFKTELFKNGPTVYGQVWLTTSLMSISTSLTTMAGTGNLNIKELFLDIPSEVIAYYKVSLVEKNDWWTDREIGSQVIIYRISVEYLGRNNYEVVAKDKSGKILLETSGEYLDFSEIESYYSGRPLLFHFPDIQLKENKEYYLEGTLYFVNSEGWVNNSGGIWGTHGFNFSSSTDAKAPAEFGTPSDSDRDCITDTYDHTFGNIPTQPSDPSPADKTSGVSTSVLLSWNSSDPDGDLLLYDVFLGRNSNPTTIVSSNQSNMSYQCSNLLNNTTYYWKIIAKDNHGNISGSASWSFTTTGIGPVASFTTDKTSITLGETVSFTDQSTNNPTNWLWDFGDGSTSQLKNPVHQYTAPGIYSVSLAASNTYGTDKATKTNLITVGNAPLVDFSASSTLVIPGTSIQFTDRSSNNPTSWTWDFGDGSTSRLQNPTHMYSTAGTFTISLSVSNLSGSNTKTVPNYISVGNPPTAAFFYNPSIIPVGGSVEFTNLSYNSDRWLWNFGDGTTSTSKGVSHIYTTPGIYSVSLTAYNNYSSNTHTIANCITVSNSGFAPISAFTVNKTVIAVGETVTFTDQSSNNPTNWLWNFGDNSTSNERNPSHLYTSAGTYNVSLTSSNIYGSDEEIKNGYIIVNQPISEIQFNPNLIYGTINDVDGNTYRTIQIGTQTWMAENLKTTKYNDNSDIPLEINGAAWIGLTSPAYCWYNNSESTYKNVYGALYNWYAVDPTSNGGKNVCPTNWHVPKHEDWEILLERLGSFTNTMPGYHIYYGGGRLKEEGMSHWLAPNEGGSNDVGFTALPGGIMHSDGNFYGINEIGSWWSSTPFNNNAFCSQLDNTTSYLIHSSNIKDFGFSVRCVRN